MKILKSGIEMTPEELNASKAGKACACGCQLGFDSEMLHGGGSEETACECGCINPPYPEPETYSGTANFAFGYPY